MKCGQNIRLHYIGEISSKLTTRQFLLVDYCFNYTLINLYFHFQNKSIQAN